jgi:hypothetical protein
MFQQFNILTLLTILCQKKNFINYSLLILIIFNQLFELKKKKKESINFCFVKEHPLLL